MINVMAQSIPSMPIAQAFVIKWVLVVGNLSEILCPGSGHLSIFLEAANIVLFFFTTFHLKNFPYLDSYRYFYNFYFLWRCGQHFVNGACLN